MSRINPEDIRQAARKIDANASVENFKETEIKKVGKAVTSVIETDRGIKLFSKCWDLGLYPEIKQKKVLEYQPPKEDGKSLFNYEKNLLSILNGLDRGIAPLLYSAIDSQQRIFMEVVNHSLHSKLTEIDKQAYLLDEERKLSGKPAQFTREMEDLNKKKESWIIFGLDRIHYFQKICNENANSFSHLKIKGVNENIDEQKLKNYLFRIFRTLKGSMKTDRDITDFLEKKSIDLNRYMPELTKHFLNLEADTSSLSFIHGDCGPHHIMSNGKHIDFDKFRRDSSYRDLSRFLRNPHVNLSEEKIPHFLAYFLMKNRSNEKEGEVNFEKLSLEEKINLIGKDNYLKASVIFDGISMEEDFRIAAVLGKYRKNSKSISFFVGNHPKYKTRNSLIRWYLEDLYKIILRYNKTNGLKDIASLFEETGLIKRFYS